MRFPRLAIALLATIAAACASGPESTRGRAGPRAAAAISSSALRADAPQVRTLDRKGWVEVRATVGASDTESPASARERALGKARRAAVESVAGVQVKSGLLSYEQVRDSSASSLVQVLTATRADALIVDERVVGSQMSPAPRGGYAMSIVLQARVLDRGASADPDFQTEVRLSQSRFFDGDEVGLAVRASRDARIYVLGITPDGAAILLPNRHLPDTRVRAGEWIHFPEPSLQERGVRLRAQLPEGRSSASEALVVIALRGDQKLASRLPGRGRVFRQTDAEGAGAMLADLVAPLVELSPDAWAFDQVVYEVMAR